MSSVFYIFLKEETKVIEKGYKKATALFFGKHLFVPGHFMAFGAFHISCSVDVWCP